MNRSDRRTETAGPAHDRLTGRLAGRAAASVGEAIRVGRETYDRTRHLPRLIGLTPAELADHRPASRRAILARLARALRQERARGRAGHWTYDLNRHIALRQAYAAESRGADPGGRAAKCKAATPSPGRPLTEAS